MRRNFLADMRKIDDALKHHNLDEERGSVFQMVVDFVEGATFTPSKPTKFLCKNWRYNAEELSVIWESKTGKAKKLPTIRGQISELSSALYQIFPTFTVDLFLSRNYNQEDCDQIVVTIEALRGMDISADSVFISEVLNWSESSRTKQSYNIDELESTLALLKPFMRSQVFKVLDDVDEDKLKYVIKCLREPLIQTHGRGLSQRKLEIINRLGLVTPMNPVKQESGESVQPVKPKVVYVQEETDYEFDDWKSLTRCLEEFAEKPDTEHMGYSADSPEFKKAMSRVKSVLSLYTVSGLKKQLEKCWPVSMKLALSDIRKKRG